MRSPFWQRDELILALDTYFSVSPNSPDPLQEEVRELSCLLRALQPTVAAAAPAYRSPASVVMKLMNFRSLDPTYKGVGLSARGQMDQVIWDDFMADRHLLSRCAAAIREANSAGHILPGKQDGPEITEAMEGRLLTRMHTLRERDGQIVERRKTRALAEDGKLACEACGFDFEATYGEAGHRVIECHHVLPLAELPGERRTRLEDLALLCANCHRIVHSRRKWLTLKELRAILSR